MPELAALNIETEANADLIDQLPEPDVKYGRMTDPAKKKEKYNEVKAKQLVSCALDPHFGRVTCVTFSVNDNGWKTITRFRHDLVEQLDGTMNSQDAAESMLISWISKQLGLIKRIVTFNGAGFDFPFLARRALLLNIAFDMPECGKYRCGSTVGEHVDMMQVLHNTELGFGQNNPMNVSRSLAFYAQQILGKTFPHVDLDQSKLGELIATGGEGKAIVQSLCEWNTDNTLHLFNRCRTIYP